MLFRSKFFLSLAQRPVAVVLLSLNVVKMTMGCCLGLSLWTAQELILSAAAIAQGNVVQDRPGTSPSLEAPLEIEPPQPLPDPQELFGPDFESVPLPEQPLPNSDIEFVVTQFTLVGSTVYQDTDFTEVFVQYLDKPITFEDVLAVRNEITAQYQEDGYLTSGAVILPQSLGDGVVELQIVEGRIEDIIIEGGDRLKSEYVRSRLGLGAQTPLQIDDLLEQLQLLQQNRLLENISADLQAGTVPGSNLLVVAVSEADSFDLTYSLDNNRSPSVGRVRNQFSLTEANFLGYGDSLSISHARTEGSHNWDFTYSLPISPHNTSLTAYYSTSSSDIIESPFDVLEATSEASIFELTLQHPVIQKPTTDLTLGLIGSYQRTQTFLGIDDIGGFPLSIGADDQGRTQVSALRFFQTWSHRTTEQVIALRSQFNFGLDAFGANVSDDPNLPDSVYFSWLGQGQWIRLLTPDLPLILRGSVQLTPDFLPSIERYSLGGQATVRGYRQNAVLTDNGVALSMEARLPIWRDPERDIQLQLTPFVDTGLVWNNEAQNPDPNSLVGIGAGLLFQYGDASLRIDWGVPLITFDEQNDIPQDQGLYFTLNVPFL